MLDCDPPTTRTAPTSILTLRFFAAGNEPVSSSAQLLPSRYTRLCCWVSARGARNANSISVPANLPVFITFTFLSSSYLSAGEDARTARPLVNLRQLGQHGAGLRPDVLVLVILGKQLQHGTHTAVSL